MEKFNSIRWFELTIALQYDSYGEKYLNAFERMYIHKERSELLNLRNWKIPVSIEEKIKEKANLKIMQNICISTAVSLWSVYFFKPNVMYQFLSQLFKELNVYNWYLLRSIELIIALAVLTWLLKYSVKQIRVVYKTKKVVVLKLSKTR